MNKKALIIVCIVVLVAAIGGFKFLSLNTSAIGGLRVESTPRTSVFLNDKLVGETPIEDKQRAGKYILKLIPQDAATQSSSWQGNISIYPSVLTYVNRQLGVSELTSSGEVLTLEKISGSESQVSVSSQPDAATILLDGQEKAITPTTFSVTIGDHDVTVTSAGFVSRTTRIQATAGYKVVVQFQLALSGGAITPSPTIASSSGIIDSKASTGPSILIKDTPTGFLRVRSSASTSATEIGQVKPGEKFPLLDESQGWYKISFQTNKEGWVSSRYAEKAN
ncbi:PEGA domain-containing protein [Candidatus Gottesmanbacteria bacterium]|nr:PEGA domain-containing protein [Candidatus Gottesmanbacteria bacterium]